MPGRVVLDSIPGRSLAHNRCGDPTVRTTPIYLPPSYDTDPERHFPTIYLLAGYSGCGMAYLNHNPWAPTMVDRLDALMTAGCPEFVAVMPDGFTRWGGGQYLDSPAQGRYQSYVADDLVGYVDAHYRTLQGAAHRGVAGKSSGGFGALRLGMERPDRFGGVVCHSGDVYFEYAYRGEIAQAAATVAAYGGVGGFVEHFERTRRKSSADFATMNVLAMACAYSPAADLQVPGLGADLPFDLESYAFRPDVWERWLAHDPLHMLDPARTPAAAEHAANLRALRLLFLDVGTRDEYHLHLGARLLVRRLWELQVAHRYDEFDDGHRDTAYRYEISLPQLAAALSAEPHKGEPTTP
jgi:S-formylglutathione hydrolase FrmB